MKHLFKTILFFFILFYSISCDTPTLQKEKISSDDKVCVELLNDFFQFYISFASENYSQDSSKQKLYKFLLETQEELNKEQISTTFEKDFIKKAKIEILNSKIKVPCFDRKHFEILLDSLGKKNLTRSFCEKGNLVKQACHLLVTGCMYSSCFDYLELKLFHPDTLVLKPKRDYSFSFRLEFKEGKNSALKLNNLVSINGEKTTTLNLKTRQFSNKIQSDTFNIVLNNKLTGENWSENYIIYFKLEK